MGHKKLSYKVIVEIILTDLVVFELDVDVLVVLEHLKKGYSNLLNLIN